MFLKLFPYLLLGFTAFLATISNILLRRFTKIAKDKIFGITVTVSLLPCCIAVLIMVYLANRQFNWISIIIASLPLMAYYFSPIWYKVTIVPQLKFMEKIENNRK